MPSIQATRVVFDFDPGEVKRVTTAPPDVTEDPLRSPAKAALSTRLAHVAERRGDTLRMAPAYGDFAALPLRSEEAWCDLAKLLADGEEVALAEPVAATPLCEGLAVADEAQGFILVAAEFLSGGRLLSDRLGDADLPEMKALRGKPEHGDFPPLRHRLGRFIGVRRKGRLIGMAGENLAFPGYVELAGLVVAPGERGRGLGARLVRDVAAAIQMRGETPFAIITETNLTSLDLFERLGFVRHCSIAFTVVRKAARHPSGA